MATPLQISIRVTGQDQVKRDLVDIATVGKRTMAELGADAKAAADASATTDRALAGVARRVRDLAAAHDPAAASALKLRSQLTDLDRAVQHLGFSEERATKIAAGLRREHEAVIAGARNLGVAVNDNSRLMVAGAASAGQMRASLVNLGQQAQDVVVSLAAGQNPMQVLLQQGSQIATVFAATPGGVVGVLGAAGTAIRSIVTPTTLAIGGLTALAGAFAFLTVRSMAATEQVRQYNLIAAQLGRGATLTTGQLEASNQRLRTQGISATLAEQQRQAILRTPTLNPSMSDALQLTGAGIGATLRVGPEAGFDRLIQTIQAGPQATINFAQSLGALTAKQAEALTASAALGNGLKEQNAALAALDAKYKDFARAAMTPFEDATNNLSGAWDRFLTKLQNTGPIKAAEQALIDVLNGLSGVAKSGAPAVGQPGAFSDSWSQWVLDQLGLARQPGGSVLQRDFGGGGNAGAPPPGARTFTAPIPPPGGLPTWTQAPITQGPFLPNSQFGGANAQIMGAAERLRQQIVANPSGNVALFPSPGQIASGSRSTLTGFGSFVSPEDIEKVNAATAAIARQKQDTDLLIKSRQALTIEQQANAAAEQKYVDFIRQGATEQQARTAADDERRKVIGLNNAELQKESTLTEMRISGAQRVAEAFKQSSAAGYQAIAQVEAEIEATTRGGNATDIARRKLEESAASAIQAGQQQVAAALPQVAAAERIAEATKLGTEAQRAAELQAQASAKTQDALAKAEASRNPILIAQAKALNDAALAEVNRADAARRTTAAFSAVNDNRRTLEVIDLQTRLVGQDPAQIERTTSLLAAQQRIATDFAGASEEAKQAYLDTATAIADARVGLIEATRETERWSDIFRSIASSIESTLTGAIERSLSGEKIRDWGERIRSMLSSALSTLTANLFIRPALGSIAGGLGFGNVAQQFGSFGSIFGGSSAPVATLTPNSSGGFNISTLSSGASLVNNVSGGGIFGSSGSSGGLFGTGGITNFLNNDIGTSLGFWGGVPNAPGMFGTTTFTGFLGGAGAGLGAGMFLNSILGGDPITGGIGSGVGSLAGAAIGSLFGGPMIGGLLGGALGSLFGLFGNQKPSNASAGGLLDLASGQITSGFAGGNQQIDQQTQQVVTSIAAITEALTAAGGTLQGNLLIQGGVNTGFTVDSTLPGFQGRFELGKDPMAAIQMIGLALTQSVEGASETVQTILAQTTDLNRLTENLAFAQVYDNIETAVEESFANIEDATKRAGPFDVAMQQITATFEDITRRATEFGLALEPVNAALAEATRRLQEDFVTAVNATLLEATGMGGVNFIQAAWDQYFASTVEANAVGLTPEVDPQVHHDLGQIFTAQVNAALAGMTPQQIDEAVLELSNLSDTVFPDLAAAAREVAAATAPALASLNALAEALTIGEVSGLTGAAAVQAQQQEFLSTQAAVAAGTQTYDDLAAAGNALINASIQAYGNGPQTEEIRQLILATINPILAGSFASGTTSTPPGMILVGEQGPELITQPGGLQVFNNADTIRMLSARPQMPTPANDQPSYNELIGEIRDLKRTVAELLDGGNRIAAVGFRAITLRQDRQLDADTAPVVVAPVRRVV